MWHIKEKYRRILKEEKGCVVKDWGAKTSIALVYPNTYYLGMSNLAIHTLYKLFNDHQNIVCERAFLPTQKEIEEHKRTGTPILSLESQRPLSEFDCLAFSVSFQNDFLNIIPILSLCSIPNRKSERTNDHPLLIAGGCAVTINYRPLKGIFDVFMTGEAEESIDEIIPVLNERAPRNETIAALPKIGAPKRFVKNLDPWPTQTVIYTPNTEFGNMHLIEMGRGCPRKCKFCVTPCIYNPVRVRSFDAILDMIKSGLSHRNRFGLIGADLLSHKSFFETVDAIHNLGATFSPSSLRVDAINEKVAQLLAKSGHKSISLGVETGSDKLRHLIGKDFSNEQILNSTEILAKHGITQIRLYFMIGLPNETEEDLVKIAELSKNVLNTIQKSAPKKTRSTSVTLTIAPFVPKPMTAFENAKFADEKYLKRATQLLKKLLGKTRGIKLHTEPISSAIWDAKLSLGDITNLPSLDI